MNKSIHDLYWSKQPNTRYTMCCNQNEGRWELLDQDDNQKVVFFGTLEEVQGAYDKFKDIERVVK